MAEQSRHLVAFDCGNSSLRVVLGNYDGSRITTETVYQVDNTMVKVGDYYYWDVLRIFHELKKGLRMASQKAAGKISSIGICTWGVDFALFDECGNMLANPLSYRNEFGSGILDRIGEDDRRSMFYQTGILCDRINSVFRIAGMLERMPGLVRPAKKLLMIPDVLGYLFTSRMWNEPSELSTSQLLNVKENALSNTVLNRFSIPKDWFADIPEHGGLLGYVTEDICDELGIAEPIPVVHVASHDTASAVVAIPAQEEDFVFISSGTWSLIGTELKAPLINDDVYEAGFTNETGAMHTITLLRNSPGMFILQRLREEYEQATGNRVSWDQIVQMAKSVTEKQLLFDVNAEGLFNPKLMHKAIMEETGRIHAGWPALFHGAYHSIAQSYAKTIRSLQTVLKKEFDRLYIVGGGAANEYLNRVCANVTEKTVITGATESTSLGNMGLQLKYFDPSLSLPDIRRIVKNSITVKTYAPEKS